MAPGRVLAAARPLLLAALGVMAAAAAPAGAATQAVAADAPLPVVGISSSDLEFMLRTARICNGRVAAARVVIARSGDHATRKFARAMLVDYLQLRRRLRALARDKGVALPSGTTHQMADVEIALRGLPAERVGQSFFGRVGVDAERDAAALFARQAADPQAWHSLRELARSALPGARHRMEVAAQLYAAREAGVEPPSPAMLIPTPG